MDVSFHSVRLNEPIQPHRRESVSDIILENFKLVDRDIVIITSKIVAILEGRVAQAKASKVAGICR